jgi:hypothetical protein
MYVRLKKIRIAENTGEKVDLRSLPRNDIDYQG